MNPADPPAAVREALATGTLLVEGQLAAASNATLRCTIEDLPGIRCVYKPAAGERPLWDFPTGTLSGREVAFYALSRHLGWDRIPCTVWREDGPFGPGSCQLWIDEAADASVVDLVPVGTGRDGWAVVVRGQDGSGRLVELVHATTRELQELALLDAIANNADRKGGHIIIDPDGRPWGIDHGVSFHAEDKLRSVLWGWADAPIPPSLLVDVTGLARALDDEHASDITRWLTAEESTALQHRVAVLCRDGRFPLPSATWPSIPWPVF